MSTSAVSRSYSDSDSGVSDDIDDTESDDDVLDDDSDPYGELRPSFSSTMETFTIVAWNERNNDMSYVIKSICATVV